MVSEPQRMLHSSAIYTNASPLLFKDSNSFYMNPQTESDLTNKFLEFRNTSTKIGLEEALVQFRTVGQQDWKFEVLCELYFIHVNVQNKPSDRANKTIRSVARSLSNETFLQTNGFLVSEVIELYDDIVYQQGCTISWKYLLEGFVYLPTRCELIKGLVENNKIAYKEFLDELLHCVHRLDSRYSLQLSEMIYQIVEEYPNYSYMIRFKLLEMQVLPDLITRITVIYCRDTVTFLNGIFHGNATWFMAQSVNSGQYFIKMKHRIIAEIESIEQKSEQILDPVALSSAVRALVGIVGYFGIKLTETEAALCMKILDTTRTERVVKLLLCLILLSADQFLKKQNELSQILYRLLQSEISEMPLLILVYFQTDDIQQVESIIRNVLAMHVPIAKLGLFEMQKLFRSLKNTAIVHATD